MIVRLHWQKPLTLETKFVGEGEFTDIASVIHAWAHEVFTNKLSDCPDGWVPMIEVSEDQQPQ